MARDARAEAFDRIGGRYEVRVLEPSPPAVNESPWFADDPVARGTAPVNRQLVSPVPTGDLLWEELARDDSELAGWCAERWLGPCRRLGELPDTVVGTRETLHRVAEDVMKPAREQATGKFGLRYTLGGFGTPFFGAGIQLRVEHDQLIRELPDGQDHTQLAVDVDGSHAIGDWFGFAYSVLETIRAQSDQALEPSRVQIWPEHFDAALELGTEAASQRAAYGASPGDEAHREPYLYVAPWSAKPTGDLWQAEGFTGAELPHSELLASDDQRALALSFFRTRLQDLTR